MIAVIAPLPSVAKGSLYSQQLGAESGVPPYTWASSKDQGQTGLPIGLSISTSGLISGNCSTDNATGVYTCTIKVTDNDGQLGAIITQITVTD